MRNFLATCMVCVLLWPTLALGKDVQATVDTTYIGENESLHLTITLPGGEADVDTDAIRDFKVMSQGTSTSVQIINGKVSKETLYNYLLVPLKSGRLTIPALAVHYKGKVRHTRPITVTVAAAGTRKAGVNRDVWVSAQVSDISPFESQQFLYTFKVYRSVQIANGNLQAPDFQGFTANQVDNRKPYKTVVGGREVVVTEVTYVLIPLKAGDIEIGPGVLTCDVAQPVRRRRPQSPFDSFFNDPFFGRQQFATKVFRSNPIPITVKPLPAYQGRETYSGLVGEFTIQAKLASPEVNLGDSTTLTITVKGVGNVMDTDAPKLNIPKVFKTYADAPETKTQTDDRGFNGRKIFRYALVGVQAGTFTLPPVSLTYFDVKKEAYETLHTQALSLTVKPGAEKAHLEVFGEKETNVRAKLKKKKVEFTGRDILPLKEDLDALTHTPSFSFGMFMTLLAVPPLLFGIAVLGLRFTRKGEGPKKQMARKARQALGMARKSGVADTQTWGYLHKALVAAVFSKAGQKGESLTSMEAVDMLRACGCPQALVDQVPEQLKAIESRRYGAGGMDDSADKVLFKNTQSLVRRLLS